MITQALSTGYKQVERFGNRIRGNSFGRRVMQAIGAMWRVQ